MPGKYSHSVVLADYSSRGIISLPNDQHVAYLRSSPYPASQHSRQSSNTWADGSPNTQPRAKSALAFSGHRLPRNGSISSPSRRIIVNPALQTREETTRITDNQRPATSHASRVLTDRDKLSSPEHSENSFHNKITMPSKQEPIIASQKSVNSSPQKVTQQRKYDQAKRMRAEDFLREMSSPQLRTSDSLSPRVQSVNTSAETKATAPKLVLTTNIPPNIVAGPPVGDYVSKVSPQKVVAMSPVKTLQRDALQQDQTPVSKSEILQPHFDGFSDAEDGPLTYFEKSTHPGPFGVQPTISQSDQQSDKMAIPPARGPATNAQNSGARTNRSVSSEPSDPESIADARASPLNSHGKLDSMTSFSTTSSRGGRLSETKSSAAQHNNQDWRLPEIDENHIFGADFFTQGPEDPVPEVNGSESVDSFLDKPLGTVSAGRDVDFSTGNHDDEGESETDPACPPDIGRFRDDEFGDVPSLQKMKSDSMLSKSANLSIPRKISLFARFRSKSRARG